MRRNLLIMTKRIIAIALCLFTLLSVTAVFAGCSSKNSDDKGAYITMYLTSELYDFDPANAYTNSDSLNIVSLLFDTLFKLDQNGNIQKSLVKDYKFTFNDLKKEYKLVMTLNETYWSDGNRMSAEDVVFAWKRILNWESSYPCAALLYDIKNARAVKNGNESIDQLGVKASGDYEVTVEFEYAVDKDQFLMNLTSLALAPLRESDVTNKGTQYNDWAKKPGFLTSGPFKVSKAKYPNGSTDKDDPIFDYGKFTDNDATDGSGNPINSYLSYAEAKLQYFVLERNTYYYRDKNKDAIDKSVTPYQILCDCTRSDEEIMQAYQNGEIFYIGEIPFSVRGNSDYRNTLSKVTVTDALSTFVLAPNEDALVYYKDIETYADGRVKLFNKNDVELNYSTYEIKTDSKGKCYVNLYGGSAQNNNPYYDLYSSKGKINITKDGLGLGDKLFADVNVRQALSLAIDREAIADAVVYAKAATGLVSTGLFSSVSSKTDFRVSAGNQIGTSANLDEAYVLLDEAGINPDKYAFRITVNANDPVHAAIADMIAEYWGENGLGFHVTVYRLGAIVNNDYNPSTASIPQDIADDLFGEAVRSGHYQVAAYDYVAYSADAFGMLAPFAVAFSGNGVKTEVTISDDDVRSYSYSLNGNVNGYSSDRFDLLMEAAYYLQFYRNISTAASSNDYKAFGYFDKALTDKNEAEAAGRKAFSELMEKVAGIYEEFDISTERDLEKGRTTLLVAAEKVLMDDMALIPIIFNQNAVLTARDLNNVSASYYVPALFQKATLYKYSKYADEFSTLLK